jgi:replication factor C large subunit
MARAAAHDMDFRIVEMNASDVRTEKAIDLVLEPARTSSTLDSYVGHSRGNLILIDEVDGVFGREDRGGLGAILSIIQKSPVPVVLTANNVENERFGDLLKVCLAIDLFEVRPRLLVLLLNHILNQEHRTVSSKFVDEVARTSRGDMRSAINDIQAIVTTKAGELGTRRTQKLDEKQTLRGLFASENVSIARRVLDQTEIALYGDELLLLLHDLLPYVYTSAPKLAVAYEALSRSDIGYGRIGASRSRGMMPPPFNIPRRDAVPNWSIFPFVLNTVASVGVQKPDNEIEHAAEIASRVSQKVPERYQYRLWQLDRLCRRIARALHISKRTALSDIVPFLVAVFESDEAKGRRVSMTLDLEEQDIAFLFSEAKVEHTIEGTKEILDPSGFKLPYMGKDKFVQLMRAGLSYDRKNGRFVVRRLENLDSVEESVSQIISKPVKFMQTQQTVVGQPEGDVTKECYVDANSIQCAKCKFIDDCPTHSLSVLKYCLCDATLADAKSYDKYVAKSMPLPTPEPQKVTRRRRAKATPKKS